MSMYAGLPLMDDWNELRHARSKLRSSSLSRSGSESDVLLNDFFRSGHFHLFATDQICGRGRPNLENANHAASCFLNGN